MGGIEIEQGAYDMQNIVIRARLGEEDVVVSNNEDDDDDDDEDYEDEEAAEAIIAAAGEEAEAEEAEEDSEDGNDSEAIAAENVAPRSQARKRKASEEPDAGDSDSSSSFDSQADDSDESDPESSSSDVEGMDDDEDDVVKAIIANTKTVRSHPPDIVTEEFVVDLSFHPEEDILAVGTLGGDILVYKYANEENTLLTTLEMHTKAIRDIEFNDDGSTLYSASKDKSIVLSDVHTGKLKRFYDDAHTAPVYRMNVIDENLFASGEYFIYLFNVFLLCDFDWEERNGMVIILY